jgi:hypothetical protein
MEPHMIVQASARVAMAAFALPVMSISRYSNECGARNSDSSHTHQTVGAARETS